MKYGLVINGCGTNIGDDVWAYSVARFLPHIDYIIDRRFIATFCSQNDEDVAVIMGGYLSSVIGNFYSTPPLNACIIPKYIGAFWGDYALRLFDTNIGLEYLSAYAPIGLRDEAILSKFDKIYKPRGVPSWFSGCLSLTLDRDTRGGGLCRVRRCG